MLYLITQPMTLVDGVYSCSQINKDDAVSLIRGEHGKDELLSLIHFESTAFALRKSTGLDIAHVRRCDIPQPRSGDCLLDIRIKQGTPKGRPTTVDDFEFYRIDFVGSGYDKAGDSTGWPMVLK